MPRPGGPPSQRRPAQQPPHAPHSQYPHHPQPHSQHGHHPPPQHQPFSPEEASALLMDLAGAAAAATLMLVLTCWLLSLGGAFAAGHVPSHSPAATGSAPSAATAQH